MTSAADAVEQARQWLAAQGVEAPDPDSPGSDHPGSDHPGSEYVGPDHPGSERQGSEHPGSDRSGRSRRTERGRPSSRSMSRPRRPAREDAGDGPPAPHADPENVARNIALNKLNTQARTRHELEQALAERDVPDEVADRVLDRIQEVGLIDDSAFAAGWVESRQSRRHLSKGALRRELGKKGVPRDDIDVALESVEPEDEFAAALALATKRQPALARFPHEVQYRRLAGQLARRGFGSGTVTMVLSQVLSDRHAED